VDDYRVNLEVYNGPLDLLLYLIRREEVDIYDIPIARIAEQYAQHVELLKMVDPDLAGEFLVLAATLLEIKTRMLLPRPPAEDGSADEALGDPRADLVRQLLEYKAFKDAAGDLREAGRRQALRFARRPAESAADADEPVDLEDAQVWDLFDAFRRLMESIGQRPTEQQIIYDDTPIELHAADLLDRLQREGPLTFGRIFEGQSDRLALIGLFLALLELIRQRRVRAYQSANFHDIAIHLCPDAPNDADGAAAEPGAAAESPPEPGRYVAEPAARQEQNDDAGGESPAAGA